MIEIRAVGRHQIGSIMIKQDLQKVMLIDTYVGAPFNMRKFRPLNPFFTWQKPFLPVPGCPAYQSRSIEAIWQGTKLIAGTIDDKQFMTFPYKRPSEALRRIDRNFSYKNTNFIYNQEIINLAEARFLIYLTSYLFLLNSVVPQSLIYFLKRNIMQNISMLFYDWDENMDIMEVNESFSHSAILASWFKGTLQEDFLPKAKFSLSKKHYNIFHNEFHNLITRYNFIHEKFR